MMLTIDRAFRMNGYLSRPIKGFAHCCETENNIKYLSVCYKCYELGLKN